MGPGHGGRAGRARRRQRFGFELEPVDAYGDRNPELIQRVTRKMLAEHAGADATFEPGDLVEFAAPNGGRYSGVLRKSTTSLPCSISTILSRACACAWTWRCWECCDERARYRRRRRVVLAQPRGFCAGVDRAIDIVERALELHGAPISCAMRSSITAMWWKTCAPRARCSSTSSRTPPRIAIVVFSATACLSRARADAVACRCSTPPARW